MIWICRVSNDFGPIFMHIYAFITGKNSFGGLFKPGNPLHMPKEQCVEFEQQRLTFTIKNFFFSLLGAGGSSD